MALEMMLETNLGKGILFHFKHEFQFSDKISNYFPHYQRNNVQKKSLCVFTFFVLLLSFSSGKSSIFAGSNKVDTPSLLHINSISCPSFRWSIYGQTMVKRWSMLRVRTNYFRKEKIWLK